MLLLYYINSILAHITDSTLTPTLWQLGLYRSAHTNIYIKVSDLRVFQGCLSFHRSHIPEVFRQLLHLLPPNTWCPTFLPTAWAAWHNSRKAVDPGRLQMRVPCCCPSGLEWKERWRRGKRWLLRCHWNCCHINKFHFPSHFFFIFLFFLYI